jgi:hypothetical protein
MKKAPPFEFVLEELASANPYTKPMFGCVSVYIDDKIMLVLREKDSVPRDNGLWIATTEEHHESLKKQFPKMRSISIFGAKSSWQLIPSDADDFEPMAVSICDLILKRDARIGKIPNSKKPKKSIKRKKRKTT